MSASFVVDASVGFSWVHQNQATKETDTLLDEIASGGSAVVPSFWFLEMANVLLMAQRRNRLSAAQRRAALATLDALDLTVDEAAPKTAFYKISELAEKHGLTAYDAAYLEVALRRKLPLATRDAALIAAAKDGGIKTL
jgi:predicted nucleic acid-binding protein